jgi:hypothetical protein
MTETQIFIQCVRALAKESLNLAHLNWRENLLVREILKAKLPEPGGGCNVEHSRLRRARH